MTPSLLVALAGILLARASQAPPAVPAIGRPCPPAATTLRADLDRSAIKWRGTKFWGLGSHEGTVALTSGEVCVTDGRLVGATFVADMRSIEVTDLPASDPVPRKRLRDHLLGEDFFSASAHPEARLIVSDVTLQSRSLYRVGGQLTIRGITHPVTFYARIWTLTNARVQAQATIEVERHRWGVSYRGSTIRDDLVDDIFTLTLTLEAGGR